MTYELKTGVSLFDLYRNRSGPLLRRRGRSIVWPARPGAVPEIPFKAYDEIVRDALRNADAANKRVEDFIGKLNGQRKS